jgi:hypothetical protein
MKHTPMSDGLIFAVLAAAAGIGSGRLLPSIAAVVGLTGVVIGGLALGSRAGGRFGRGGTTAVVAGLISLTLGGLHAANSAGGFGTGNGLAGAIVAIVLGLVSLLIGGLAMARLRHGEQ